MEGQEDYGRAMRSLDPPLPFGLRKDTAEWGNTKRSKNSLKLIKINYEEML